MSSYAIICAARPEARGTRNPVPTAAGVHFPRRQYMRLLARAVLSAICILTTVSQAQIKSGVIIGLVTDKTGAVIADAGITVMNEETQVVDKGKSGGAGEYAVPYLAAGRYTVTVEKPGLSAFQVTGVVLGTGQQARVNAQLQLGSVGTTIQVQAEAISLQTESTSVQGRVDSRVIEGVPDINHNPFYFATLEAGIVARNELISSTNPYSFGVGMYSRDRLRHFRSTAPSLSPLTSPWTESASWAPP